ncbi:MAG: HTH-type transcriptional activator NahR [Pseudomonadota bacterium]
MQLVRSTPCLIEPCNEAGHAELDLNLLVTLAVSLAEGSMVRAAKRLQLSPSAMSRTLAH